MTYRPEQLQFNGPITETDRAHIRAEVASGAVFNWSSLMCRWGVPEHVARGMWAKWSNPRDPREKGGE